MTHALQVLAPGAEWTIKDEDYSTLTWHNDNFVKPSLEECQAKIAELDAAEPMRQIREHRDKLLSDCDWVVVRAHDTNTPVPADWASYRQSLRDFPATNPSYEIDPMKNHIKYWTISWPTPPSA